jgi:4-hydroxybenzoate polyprenyltransferase
VKTIPSLIKMMRVHHWVKNVLVGVPLVTSYSLSDTQLCIQSLLATAAFCLIASGTYIFNDVLDLKHDRLHPMKRLRPIAAGEVSISTALLLMALLIGLSLVISLQVNLPLTEALVVYLAVTVAYSHWFKSHAILDVLILVLLWNLRLYAGALAIDVDLSVWLLSFGAFLFLSLSFLKRATELKQSNLDVSSVLPGRGYQPADLIWLSPLGIGCGVAAIVVLALFVDSSSAQWHYTHPERLWLMCPAVFYWLARLWLKMHRGDMHHDPVYFSLTDRASWMAGGVLLLSIICAHAGV